MPIKDQRPRLGGSGYTVFTWEDNIIGFARQVVVTSPEPVAPAAVIQPLNAFEPIEILTAGASGPGTIEMTLVELYNTSVWQRLANLANSQDLIDIMRTIAKIEKDGGIQIKKIVLPPIPRFPTYIETFYNCVVTDVRDGETINIETMQIEKPITVQYTHSKKSWINGGSRANPPNQFNQQA